MLPALNELIRMHPREVWRIAASRNGPPHDEGLLRVGVDRGEAGGSTRGAGNPMRRLEAVAVYLPRNPGPRAARATPCAGVIAHLPVPVIIK